MGLFFSLVVTHCVLIEFYYVKMQYLDVAGSHTTAYIWRWLPKLIYRGEKLVLCKKKIYKISYSYRNPCIHSPYSCNITNPFHLHSAILKSRNHTANQQELNFRCKETSLSGLPLCILKKQKTQQEYFRKHFSIISSNLERLPCPQGQGKNYLSLNYLYL